MGGELTRGVGVNMWEGSYPWGRGVNRGGGELTVGEGS